VRVRTQSQGSTKKATMAFFGLAKPGPKGREAGGVATIPPSQPHILFVDSSSGTTNPNSKLF